MLFKFISFGLIISFVLCISSCGGTTALTGTATNISTVNIGFDKSPDITDENAKLLEQVIKKGIEKFNALPKKSFTAVYANADVKKDMSFNIVDKKLRSNGSRIAGALISLFGFTATPYIVNEQTNGRAFAVFYIFPLDFMNTEVVYAQTALKRPEKRHRRSTNFAIFSTPEKRTNELLRKFENIVYTELYQFNNLYKKEK